MESQKALSKWVKNSAYTTLLGDTVILTLIKNRKRMIEVEFISGAAIGFAIGTTLTIFISIIKRFKNRRKEIPFYDIGESGNGTESFIEIPLEKMMLKKPRTNSSGIDHLKDKIKRFKTRNRFYH